MTYVDLRCLTCSWDVQTSDADYALELAQRHEARYLDHHVEER